jgi:polyisoprenoid-binding protein YceI
MAPASAPAEPTAPKTQAPPASAAPTSPAAAAPVAAPPAATPPSPPTAPSTPSEAKPTAATYTLDPAKGAVYVQVFKDAGTVAAGLSHDHVVRATGWSGTVRWDPADPSGCRISLTVPVTGLRTDEDSMRKRVGYDTTLDADQREEITGNMLAAGQLDATRYTQITFASTRCEAAGDKVKVSGTLTVRGKGAPVTSTMTLAADGATLSAAGTFSAKATDFGFEPYSALLGALKNRNEMKFTVDVKGAAQ